MKIQTDHSRFKVEIGLDLGLWFLTPLSIMFQLYCGGQFYWYNRNTVESGVKHRKPNIHNTINLRILT